MFQELEVGTAQAAKRLLGSELHRKIGNELIRVRIVETEAYDEKDPASHTFRGPTARNRAMFGPAGHAYVYFVYGLHFCFNVVTGLQGFGQGALIRAVEPIEGIEHIQKIRNMKNVNITNGPGKVCAALKIDMNFYGHDLSEDTLILKLNKPIDEKEIVQTTRVGIKQGSETPWRFYLKDSRYVSKK